MKFFINQQQKKNMKNILVSFSGGRTSALMARLIQELPYYKEWNKLYVFANTGKEKEETLQFIDRCDKEWNLGVVWIESVINPVKGKGVTWKIVDLKTANRTGQPFEDVIKKHGLPSKLYRHCTRDLKEEPIHKYAKHIFDGDYLTAIGIRADEKHRISSDPKKVYPLNDLNVDEAFVRNWWDRQKFDLNIKDYEGNCDLCFLKSKRKKLTLVKENPNIVQWWNEMEYKYSGGNQPIFDVYRDLSIDDLIQLSKHPFQKAIDKHELRKQQISMFDPDMDLDFDCFCKAN
jgi:3'-phosphoadenosine 5'-phosphosulfate sulfotransferase (PAPS reductase)/FAD synthetase